MTAAFVDALDDYDGNPEAAEAVAAELLAELLWQRKAAARQRQLAQSPTVTCPDCGKPFVAKGFAAHRRAKHPQAVQGSKS